MNEHGSQPLDIDSLWDYEKPDQSEARFRDELTKEHTADLRCELLTQLARSLGLQRKFEEAHSILDQAQENAASPRCAIRALLERGRVLNSSGKPAEAKPYFLRAWELAVESGEVVLEVDAAHMIAIVEGPEGSVEWNERAMAAAERTDDPAARKWLGALYNNLAWTYHDLGQYERAFEIFLKALNFRVKMGQERPIQIARYAVGRCLRSMERLEEALSVQQELEKELEERGIDDGFVQEELGELRLAEGEHELARGHFAKAHAELSKDHWIVANEPERLERLAALAQR